MDPERKAEPTTESQPIGDRAPDDAGSVDAPPVWVVNDLSPATVRSRFYKSILLAVSCIFQLAIASQVVQISEPLAFFAFALSVVVCAGIAAQEMGALLSAIDMQASRLKKALVERDDEDASN